MEASRYPYSSRVRNDNIGALSDFRRVPRTIVPQGMRQTRRLAMSTLSRNSSLARRAAILGASALALAAGAWQYNRAAHAAFDGTAVAQPWLRSARSELGLLDWI